MCNTKSYDLFVHLNAQVEEESDSGDIMQWQVGARAVHRCCNSVVDLAAAAAGISMGYHQERVGG